MTKKGRLTHEKVNQDIRELLDPDKAKAIANGSMQVGALRSMIDRARALNNQSLNRRITRTRSR